MSIKSSVGRIPTYLDVYNSLYSDIVSGKYDLEHTLPSEPLLAQQYGVSRNTLRQALVILIEDGLIRKSQGKGTEIVPRVDANIVSKNQSPMLSQAKVNVDSIDITYNFGVPTDIAREKLQLDASSIVMASDAVYHSQGETIGYSFIQIPSHVIALIAKDMSNPAAIEELITKDIFSICEHWNMTVKCICANDMEAGFLNVPSGTQLQLLEAILTERNTPLARCKFYFLPHCYHLEFRL